MERDELNTVVKKLRAILDEKTDGVTSIKLLETLEMMIDRQEENNLLIKERLEEIINIQS